MNFKGKYSVRSKIVIDSKTVEQVSQFERLGCDTSYEYDNDIDENVHKVQAVCGTIKKKLNHKTPKKMQKLNSTRLCRYLDQNMGAKGGDTQKNMTCRRNELPEKS